MRCSRCDGLLRYSPVDDADSCFNCGRLFYHYTPEAKRVRRDAHRDHASNLFNSSIYWVLVSVLEASEYPMHVTAIYVEVTKQVAASTRYVSWLLTVQPEFEHVGRGRWRLSEGDFESG